MTVPESFVLEVLRAVRVNKTETTAEEINGLIQAAAADLKRQGVDQIDLDDALTKQAVKLYCKAHYGYDKDNERFIEAYIHLSAAMSLCSDYDSEG